MINKSQPNAKIQNPCAKHESREAELYCMDWNVPFCSKCIFIHKGHDFYDINDEQVTAGTQQNMDKFQSGLENSIKESEMKEARAIEASGLIKKRKLEIRSQIESKFSQVHDALNER